MDSWQRSTALILAVMVVTYAVVGAVLGYVLTFWWNDSGWIYGMAFFLIVAVILAAYSYNIPVDRLVENFGGRKVTEHDEPRLYRTVEDLASRAGTPMPAVYVLDEPFPNAFALGRTPDRALVAATRPLLEMLDDDELEGVMGHELSHIIHRDTIVNSTARTTARFLTVSAIVMGAIGAFAMALLGAGSGRSSSGAGGIVCLIMCVVLIPVAIVCLIMCLALPSASAVMRYGVSRSREYGADEGSARLTGKPMALASALMKLEKGCSVESNTFKDASSANLWIVNPFGKFKKRMLSGLMDTHPSTEDRVRRLMQLQDEFGSESQALPRNEDLFSDNAGRSGENAVVEEKDGFRRLKL